MFSSHIFALHLCHIYFFIMLHYTFSHAIKESSKIFWTLERNKRWWNCWNTIRVWYWIVERYWSVNYYCCGAMNVWACINFSTWILPRNFDTKTPTFVIHWNIILVQLLWWTTVTAYSTHLDFRVSFLAMAAHKSLWLPLPIPSLCFKFFYCYFWYWIYSIIQVSTT